MSGQYFGLYRGLVEENEDPKGLMRIEVSVPDVFGAEVTAWAVACVPPGVRSVPEVGTLVWIEFEAGDPSYPVWIGTARVAGSSRDGEA